MSDKEPKPVTNEIPVSLDMLTLVHRITVQYMRVKGSFYVLLGLTWVLYQSPSRLAGIQWLDIITPDMVGTLWALSGSVAIIGSFFREESRVRDAGWFLLIFTPLVLGAYFFVSWAVFLLPFLATEGYSRAGITTASYWAYGASAYLMSKISTLTSGAVPNHLPGGNER